MDRTPPHVPVPVPMGRRVFHGARMTTSKRKVLDGCNFAYSFIIRIVDVYQITSKSVCGLTTGSRVGLVEVSRVPGSIPPKFRRLRDHLHVTYVWVKEPRWPGGMDSTSISEYQGFEISFQQICSVRVPVRAISAGFVKPRWPGGTDSTR
ncbi:hypothetical protein AVEN_50146-1 [Araneus ventricosus]|uniref:Uncharacterized protein n=1 Tax=Araneus ventricosus TaxID=182803 RepID=A0A4Y2DAV2_ARAVE|nr:hypothetical protein AVEN_50146-1 [Araneus ventricosus]